MRSHALYLIIALLFLYPDELDLLKILGRVKSNGSWRPKQLAPHHWDFQPKPCWPPVQLSICSDIALPPAMLERSTFGCMFCILQVHCLNSFSETPRYIIVLKISAVWFVWLYVCNTLKQISFCSPVPSYLSMHFLSMQNQAFCTHRLEAKCFIFIIFKVLC